MEKELIAKHIWISGIVQGVGFRPFVYTQAVNNHLTGWVKNTSGGVEIEVKGGIDEMDAFVQAFSTKLPPLARIDSFQVETCLSSDFTGFEIISSEPKPGDFIPVSPDMTICPDCQKELFTPGDRRFRYPFINCTNCGPRFSIIKDIPYDRPLTTMADFNLCPQCLSEYKNPLNRRFHAQPVACSECGPYLEFFSAGKRMATHEDALQISRRWIMDGKILAIKGLGGFHLACDAFNPQAVNELRNRKRRSDKPFALMAFNLKTIEKYCLLNDEERALLCSPQHPIVLLEKRPNSTIVAETAPHQNVIGIMLAYTPLHLLLLEPADHFPELLVMTSGNLSEEPIAYADSDAFQRLNRLADGFLTHNRPIHMRVDDSVARIIHHTPHIIRRARGYAPDPILLSHKLPPILAVGAELKNTFCLTQNQYAFISHHIGDLENQETLKSFEEGINHYEKLFKITPEIIASDLHPDYLSSQYAQTLFQQNTSLKMVGVQHHHAHLVSCLADNLQENIEAAIGLIFDGTGLGTDGQIWGGEILVGNSRGFKRYYHLKNVPMPGGSLAIHKPARMALGLLESVNIDWDPQLPSVNFLCADERTVIKTQIKNHINTPLTSSMGRLFDAISSLLGIRHVATYEGQAAIEMEALSDPDENGFYSFNLDGDSIDPSPLLNQIITEWASGISVSTLSARFHNSIVHMAEELCFNIRQTTSINTVVLSGGVFQNKVLLEKMITSLKKLGFEVLYHQRVPSNDGGISLGQAVIAASLYTERKV